MVMAASQPINSLGSAQRPEHSRHDRGVQWIDGNDRETLAVERPNPFGLDGGVGRYKRVMRHCRRPTSR